MSSITKGAALAVSLFLASLAQAEIPLIKGAPPRFITVTKIDPAKDSVYFAVPLLETGFGQLRVLRDADGSQRYALKTFGASTINNKSQYLYAGAYKLPFAKAHWHNAAGKAVSSDSLRKSLKPGTTVVLSADGEMVEAAYLQLFKPETLVLVVAAEDLPIPYMPQTGGTIGVEEFSASGKK